LARRSLRNRQFVQNATDTEPFDCYIAFRSHETFITHKERADYDLVVRLRKEGKITTAGKPFEGSMKAEVDGLVAGNVFRFEVFDLAKYGNIRIFDSRFVNEVKGKATPTPFEKSRLVIQAFQDAGKALILTQSPTIQRAAQRLLISIAASLFKLSRRRIRLLLRDIM
jgi:hypothetical protein